MSVEKNRDEAARWISQAEADIRAARASTRAGSHEWACFQCQQAGAKALKAVWLGEGHDPWGHSLIRLIEQHPDPVRREALRSLLEQARLLDKLYVPTRYPNGLPDLTPAEVYGESDALAAIAAAEMTLGAARGLLRA